MDKNYGYRHTKGFVIIVLIFIIGCISVAYGQVVSGSPNTPSGYSIDSVTGNLISNGALTSGTGWASTTGSPTWTPNGAPLGSFDPVDGYTFGITSESLGQNPGINLASFSHGYLNSSAVFVTGFMYGLKYRFSCANSIGTNCDGTAQPGFTANPLQDNLRVEVGYYPYSGSPTFYTHQLGLKNINDGNSPYNPSWQQLAQTVTFAGAKPLAQAGSVNFEIIGQDAGFWGCNPNCYGPQVKDAYIRAIYSVDPCILNPAFNPSCAGFSNVLQGSKSPTFYYSYNIAQSLPHIGGGVVLHGYDYGFNWYNYGACYNTFMFWCTDWRTNGGGNINFRISDKNNTTMLQQQWYVAGNNSGGGYSNRYLFTESRNSLDMGSVQWWTSDVWNHFGWVGWTRPIWTPDPCYTNGLFSPNCTNFQSTLNQVVADIKTQQEQLAASNTVATSSTTSTPSGSITVSVQNATSSSVSVSVTTEPNQSTNQTAIATTAGSSSSNSSTQSALSLIRNNERREQSIASQASNRAIAESAAVATASQQQAASIAESASVRSQEIGATAAAQAVAASQDNRNSSSGTAISTLATTTSTTIMAFAAPTALSTTTLSQSTTQTTIGGSANFGSELTTSAVSMAISVSSPPSAVAPVNITVDTGSSTTSTQTVLSTAAAPMSGIDIKMSDTDTATSVTNFTTNRTNPITEIVESRQAIPNSSPSATTASSVNRGVQDNELAGGVSIDSIAVAPQGFNMYASLVLKDAAFYAPREIYRGQRTVDNVRALRSLGQDARHQEMVDQQYRR